MTCAQSGLEHKAVRNMSQTLKSERDQSLMFPNNA